MHTSASSVDYLTMKTRNNITAMAVLFAGDGTKHWYQLQFIFAPLESEAEKTTSIATSAISVG